MRPNQRDGSRRRAAWVYALLLRFYPRAHRQAFGPRMRQTFADHYHDAIERAGENEWRFWLSVLADVGKSVVREHLAALTERRIPMISSHRMTLIGALIVGIEVLLGVEFILTRNHTNLLPLLMLAPCVAIYTVLLALLARAVRALSRATTIPTGRRLGLVLGGIVALYVVVLTAMIAVLPVPAQGDFRSSIDSVLDLGLPLLAGVVGVIGGYARSSARIGALLGALNGFLAVVVALAAQALCVVLLWNALQHHQLQSRLAWDYQGWLQSPGVKPTPWAFLYFAWTQDGIEWFLFVLFLLLVMQQVMAAIGGVLGASASRRAGAGAAHGMLPEPTRNQARGVRLALTIVGLDLLTWAIYDLLNSSAGMPFSFATLIASFASPAFVAWLLVAPTVVVALRAAARSGALRREGSAAPLGG